MPKLVKHPLAHVVERLPRPRLPLPKTAVDALDDEATPVRRTALAPGERPPWDPDTT